MSPPLHLLRNFRSNLASAITNAYSQRQLDDLIKLSHSLAFSFIRTKLLTGKINLKIIGLTDTDLAFDCVADLYQRDHDGTLLHLKAYFESISIDELSEEALLGHLRRLVFSRVNQGLFRIYNELDPGLGKILRNIKIALHSQGNFAELEKFGEPYIVPNFCDPLLHLPELLEDELTNRLRKTCSASDRIPKLLAKLNSLLRIERDCSRAVRLMSVAYALRSFYSHSQLNTISLPEVDQTLLTDDAIRTIHQSCERMKKLNFPQYVLKKKVTLRQFNLYFAAIEDQLREECIGRENEDGSLFDKLKNHQMRLTKGQYIRYHKNILEYLLRSTRKNALNVLGKE